MNYHDHERALVPLETFDARVFVGDEVVGQDVCDFVLALALVYNDYRDVVMAHTLLDEAKPTDVVTASPALGLFNGLRTALTRIHSGLINELLVLVSDSGRSLGDAFFQQRVARQLSRRGGQAWRAVCDVAFGRASGDPLAKMLILVRNKVAFHYDARELGRAYAAAFVSPASHGSPLLCRGGRLRETRFCFADAAAQAYMFSKAPAAEARTLLLGQSEFLTHVNLSLYEIVTTFVQARGGAWQRLLVPPSVSTQT